MKIPVCILLALLAVPPVVKAGDAPEMERLREGYDGAVNRLVKPVTATYLLELQKLRDAYTRSANLKGAIEVEAEIQLVTERLQTLNSPTGKTPSLDAQVTIPANSPMGYKIGAVRRGDVLTLSYVSGTWKNDGRVPSENPDSIATERGNKSRLVIARGPKGNVPGQIITMVRPNTAKTPFVFTFQSDHDDVVLRIHSDSQNHTNPGAVQYAVRLNR